MLINSTFLNIGDFEHKKELSSQILGASTDLLGFCVVIITFLKVSKFAGSTRLSLMTALATIIFLVSCTFAYFSLRPFNKRTILYRHIADYSFFFGLFLLVICTLLFAIDLIA